MLGIRLFDENLGKIFGDAKVNTGIITGCRMKSGDRQFPHPAQSIERSKAGCKKELQSTTNTRKMTEMTGDGAGPYLPTDP